MIDHLVVLMLENRSFDCMLGRLYPGDPNFKGLTLNESNVCGGVTYPVWPADEMDDATACIPDPDPGESFYKDMNVQIFGSPDGTVPTMSGFAANYGTQPGAIDPGAVMHFFTTAQVPNLTTLATAFGVCDEWYASAPCQTWPNRFFTHTGTALGYVDNRDFPIPFPAPSIFRQLETATQSWRVYFHDMPHALLLKDVWDLAALRFRGFDQFLADAQSGTLPSYSFIEPRYFTDLFKSLIPNDQHPPHNVLYGEQLIAQVYNALRGNTRCWPSTLLIITYDEHGGCYDHIEPPGPPIALPPDGIVNNDYQFRFDRYGVRVPVVIVSPYVAPSTRLKAPTHPDGNVYPFDHTSIMATVRKLFMRAAPTFTARDGHAPDVLSALTLAAAGNDGPTQLSVAVPIPTPGLLAARGNASPNGMQAALASASTLLPRAPLTSADQASAPTVPPKGIYGTVAEAQANATARTRAFLGQTP